MASGVVVRRLIGIVYTVGPAVALVWSLLPNGTETPPLLMAALAAVAAVFGALMLAGRLDGLPDAAVEAVLVLGNVVLLPIAVVLSAAPASLIALFYLWATPYAWMFLPPRRAAAHTALTALGYAVAIVVSAAVHPGVTVPGHVSAWLVVTATAFVVGWLVRVLGEAVAVAERRFRAAFDEAGVPALITDGTDVIDANGALVRLLGVDPAGRRLADVAVADHPSPLRPAGRGEQPVLMDLRAADGRVVTVAAVARPLDHGGRQLVQCQDVTDRLAVERERGELLERLLSVGETERQRLARRLHDDAIQRLAAADLRLGLLQGHSDVPEVVAKVAADVEAAMAAMRAVMGRLHPGGPDGAGLADALDRFVTADLPPAGPPVELEVRVDQPLPTAVEEAAYRIVVEALTHVGRDDGTAHVHVAIATRGSRLIGVVSGDGAGGDWRVAERGVRPHPAAATRHLGIRSMQDRATRAGGRCEVEEATDGGTVVRFELPLDST